MKLILPIIVGIAAIALAITLYMTKQSDSAQHDADTATVNDYSNRLAIAQTQLTDRDGMVLTVSNSLDACQASAVTFSNELTDAQTALAADTQQITNLTLQVAQIPELQANNLALDRSVMALTNQMARLTVQLGLTKGSLFQTNQDLVALARDYNLLENRFRIDVGERTVLERKFRNSTELKAQLQKLKQNPAGAVSADSIYAGLDVEVRSNGTFHVIAPN